VRAGPQEIRGKLHLSNKFKRYLAVLGPTQNCFRCVSVLSPVAAKLAQFAFTGLFFFFDCIEVPRRFKLFITVKRFVIWHLNLQ